MDPFVKLDHLDINTAAKTQVAEIIQTLFEQAQQDAAALQSKELELQAKDAELKAKAAEIQFKDQKIQALSHELAHIRRIRYGVKSEALSPLAHWERSYNQTTFTRGGARLLRSMSLKTHLSKQTYEN